MAKKKKAAKPQTTKPQEEKTAAEEKSESAASTDKKSSDKKPAEKKSEKKTDKKAEKKPSVFSKIAKYFRECKSEIKKIVWPTPKTTFRNMGIVLVVLLVIGLFVYGLDTGFIALLRLVMDM